jgi:hypothetical protein
VNGVVGGVALGSIFLVSDCLKTQLLLLMILFGIFAIFSLEHGFLVPFRYGNMKIDFPFSKLHQCIFLETFLGSRY